MISRRDLLRFTGQSCLIAGCAPIANALAPTEPGDAAVRCVNVVNFIRGVEPRSPVDLLLPVQKQMELLLQHRLPATWLLQFDALVSGPFVEYLKAHIAENHEVGVWFEMNELHCKAAGVEWRGRPGVEWDSNPSVAFTIGYSGAERIKLADTAMRQFKSVWGRYPKSVASWNLDSITMAHLSEHYGVDAFAVCRDQIATDGFTIWGAPIYGYYPSKTNCWSPALDKKSQISTPVFRMLGQDPVYYYERSYPLPNGRRFSGPDTMEPVWTSGRSPAFIKNFLAMIAEAPTLRFAYAQLGQENNFGWPDMAEGFARQMQSLAELRDAGTAHVETMGESGRRFKSAFSTTPAQAQLMLEDPYGNSSPSEGSIWYQSRFYRADLHLKGDLPFLRDLTVYSDRNPQPFLTEATLAHDVEQRMPAVLDGYHWSPNPGSTEEPGAGGFFEVDGHRLRLTGKPTVREQGSALVVELPVGEGRILHLRFDERTVRLRLSATDHAALTVSFEWDPSKAALVGVSPQRVSYRWQGFEYSVGIEGGEAVAAPNGWKIFDLRDEARLLMAQTS
jgi:hypothetical protein